MISYSYDTAFRFDPLLFLGITDLKDEEKTTVSEKILDRIFQYIAIRIVGLLMVHVYM